MSEALETVSAEGYMFRDSGVEYQGVINTVGLQSFLMVRMSKIFHNRIEPPINESCGMSYWLNFKNT